MIKPLRLHNMVTLILGDYDIINSFREDSVRTRVWKIKTKKNSQNYFIKLFKRKSRWGPEVYAYKNWVPEILPYAPRLVKTIEEEDIYAIIISSIEGITLREAVNLSEEQIINAYNKAGEVTKILHEKFCGEYFGRPDCNGNPIEIYHHEDPIHYLTYNLNEILKKGKESSCFDKWEIELGKWALEHIYLFKNSIPRAINWDSSPNNWIVDEGTGKFLGLIDFENMIWGFEVDNFTIMYERYFPMFPSGKEAFFKGYGIEILEEKSREIKVACIKAGLANIIWAINYNDKKTLTLAKNMLTTIQV